MTSTGGTTLGTDVVLCGVNSVKVTNRQRENMYPVYLEGLLSPDSSRSHRLLPHPEVPSVPLRREDPFRTYNNPQVTLQQRHRLLLGFPPFLQSAIRSHLSQRNRLPFTPPPRSIGPMRPCLQPLHRMSQPLQHRPRRGLQLPHRPSRERRCTGRLPLFRQMTPRIRLRPWLRRNPHRLFHWPLRDTLTQRTPQILSPAWRIRTHEDAEQ